MRGFLWVFLVPLVLAWSDGRQVEKSVHGGMLEIRTARGYNYKYVDQDALQREYAAKEYIVFQVKAPKDALVTLARDKVGDQFDSIEIVIGGWSNTRSVIRECYQCDEKVEKYHNPLDENSFGTFWISWSDRTIRVGEGDQPFQKEFLQWNVPNLYPIKYVGVCTYLFAEGNWEFGNGDMLEVKTPKAYEYIFVDDDALQRKYAAQEYIVFQVKTSKDAHVTLTQNKVGGGTIEIVIGAWNNRRSVIRECYQCEDLAVVEHSPLDENSFRTFWISWSDMTIRVGEGDQPFQEVFLQWDVPNMYPVKYVGVCTAWHAEGTWRFGIGGTLEVRSPKGYNYVYVDQAALQREYAAKQYIVFQVKAPTDATVTLARDKVGDQTDSIEIVIGGWSNTQSVIRECYQCEDKVEKYHNPLDGNSFRTFWISWSDRTIRVGEGVQPFQKEFLQWDVPNLYSVKYVGVCTYLVAEGTWKFGNDN